MDKLILFGILASILFILAFYIDKLISLFEDVDEKEVLGVGYGTCTRGGFPVASANPEAPELMTGIHRNVDNQYVYIYPNPRDRFLAGYFVQVVGTRILYKIGNYGDDAIVIGIPEKLQGKRFTLQYAAYDNMDRVSNKITVVIDAVEVEADNMADTRTLDWMPEN
ncbi:hypothetical protein [Chitinophaga sancti]|uniref:Uncharacterized protein n=1 Tax=Chitinophaga sancti TaxID=1004 RepID=A0A1K1QS58_9BACT|nr:hypothetical protein [Chitinophaga sancti]WQD61864.1 hypothetical protein U0033_28680 [Chitinophaga sancti]WQG92567.1 hypothetical protein SR876_13705 [Chitinophaga sancti]SFW62751.1 hypothetical protein SAMN05661012_02997 [Chitinophaga sancti]